MKEAFLLGLVQAVPLFALLLGLFIGYGIPSLFDKLQRFKKKL